MADSLAHHRLAVKARVEALALDIALEFAAPWTLVFGPSGSGKSSLLRAMCGLLESGVVSFERQIFNAKDAKFSAKVAKDAWVKVDGPARTRAIAYAPQRAALFPHLSVRENVGFGAGSGVLVERALELFALRGYEGRMPRALSGGERQRVNLARAFAVPEARLMLLDEPFSGVDRGMRERLVPGMVEWARERDLPVVSVSHDVEEAMMLGAEVVRVVEGRVVAQGPAAEVLEEERALMLQVLG